MIDCKDFHPCGEVRRLDDLGRICIPKSVRDKADIKTNSAYEIFVEKDTKRILLIPTEG